ncbi:DEAD-domain-containing protein [Gyrodon lividus]|nr:DEAD-domain-containing protein [Gyrodon lividus]
MRGVSASFIQSISSRRSHTTARPSSAIPTPIEPVVSNGHTGPHVEARGEEDIPNEGRDEDLHTEDNSILDSLSLRSLKGRINYDTLKALTVRPLKLTTMTPVQTRVTSLLPDLARPWDPEGIVPPKVPNPLPPNWEPPIVDPNAPRDLLVRAKTGTGKTIAYLIPAIESRLNYIEHDAKLAVINAGLTTSPHLAGRARAAFRRAAAGPLILAPTRELATQIANDALQLTKHQKEFEVRLFVGGSSKTQQMREWMRFRRDLVVATPGRLRELLENESEVQKGFKHCPMLILDEADTLLSMGFRDDIDAILSYLPSTPIRQTFLFSATLPRSVRQLVSSIFSPNHAFIDTAPPEPGLIPPSDDELTTHDHVSQFHTLCPTASDQLPTLLKLLAHDRLTHGARSKVIVFCPTVQVTALFSTLLRVLGEEVLTDENTQIMTMHSKMPQSDRDQTRLLFSRAGEGLNTRPTVLVSSDVSAKGVDYPGVTRVIQVGVPSTEAMYVHRIGRMARGADAITPVGGKENGSPGVRADLLLLPWEAGYLTWQLTNLSIQPLPISVLDKQLASLSPQSSTLTTGFLKTAIADLHGLIGPSDIRSTAASLLGYYLPLTPSLRLQPTSVLAGVSCWASECFNVSLPTLTKSPSNFMKSYGIGSQLESTKGLFVDGVRIAGGNPSAGLKKGKGGKRAVWEGRGEKKSLASSLAMTKPAESKKTERQERTREVSTAVERPLPPHMRQGRT